MKPRCDAKNLLPVMFCLVATFLFLGGCDSSPQKLPSSQGASSSQSGSPSRGGGLFGKSTEDKRRETFNHLKDLVLGLQFYGDDHKFMFPPAYTVDANGKPLHSWRVLILPYIGQKELYRQIKLDEPWDSEYNKQFHSRDIPCFRSAGANSQGHGLTDFSMVVGPDTISNGPTGRNLVHDIKDILYKIALVERATPVCWMDPTEITQENAYKGIGVTPDGIADAFYDGKTAVGACDGSVEMLEKTIDLKILQSALNVTEDKQAGHAW